MTSKKIEGQGQQSGKDKGNQVNGVKKEETEELVNSLVSKI